MLCQRLVDDAIASGELQHVELLGRNVCVELARKRNRRKAHRRVVTHRQGSAKVDLALSADTSRVHGDLKRGRDGPQRHPPRKRRALAAACRRSTPADPVAATRGMQPSRHAAPRSNRYRHDNGNQRNGQSYCGSSWRRPLDCSWSAWLSVSRLVKVSISSTSPAKAPPGSLVDRSR